MRLRSRDFIERGLPWPLVAAAVSSVIGAAGLVLTHPSPQDWRAFSPRNVLGSAPPQRAEPATTEAGFVIIFEPPAELEVTPDDSGVVARVRPSSAAAAVPSPQPPAVPAPEQTASPPVVTEERPVAPSETEPAGIPLPQIEVSVAAVTGATPEPAPPSVTAAGPGPVEPLDVPVPPVTVEPIDLPGRSEDAPGRIKVLVRDATNAADDESKGNGKGKNGGSAAAKQPVEQRENRK